MENLNIVEIKSFVPAKDYALSKRFYEAIGFEMASDFGDVAYFSHGSCAFLLQNFYVKECADNFMMHLLVNNADDWWQRMVDNKLEDKYGVALGTPEDREWGMRDFTLIDPAGVCWRIGHNIGKIKAHE